MTTSEQQALMHKLFELMMASGHLNNQDQMAKELKAIHSLLSTRYSLSISECDNCLLYFFRDYSLGCSSPLSDSFIRTNMIPTIKNYPAMDIDAGKELLLSASMFAQSSVDQTAGEKQEHQQIETTIIDEREKNIQEEKTSHQHNDELLTTGRILFKVFIFALSTLGFGLGFILILAICGVSGDEGLLAISFIAGAIVSFVLQKKSGFWNEDGVQ